MRIILAEILKFLFKSNYLKSKHFGIHKRIFRPLNLFKGVTRKVNYKGLRLELQIDDWIQENIYFLGDYEKSELETLELFLNKDSVFIDIGANFGLFTLNASKLIGENGNIICFEPFTQNFDSLTSNLSLNNLLNVKAEKLAVGEKDGTINMYYDEQEKNLGTVSVNPIEAGIKEEVTVISLDSYLKNETFTKIDLIKIDVEGFEYSVLLGMQHTLATYYPSLLIEILDERGLDNSKKIHDLLKTLGYKKFFIDEDGKLLETEINSNRLNYIFTTKTFK